MNDQKVVSSTIGGEWRQEVVSDAIIWRHPDIKSLEVCFGNGIDGYWIQKVQNGRLISGVVHIYDRLWEVLDEAEWQFLSARINGEVLS